MSAGRMGYEEGGGGTVSWMVREGGGGIVGWRGKIERRGSRRKEGKEGGG